MKVLITGSNGQLGRALTKNKPAGIEILSFDKKQFNLKFTENIHKLILDNSPDWIINCAAYTNVDKAEKEKELALKINGEAPKEIAKAIKEIGGKLLHISTDFVFNGKTNIPYKTNSPKNPINAYGYTKSIGEDNVLNILEPGSQVIILRTSWLMGPLGNNFATKILKFLKEGREIKVIYDQISSPTNTTNLANACWKTILQIDCSFINQKKSILHWTNDGVASWYDIAFSIGQISERIGLLKSIPKINPIRSKDYVTDAKRPNYSVLDTSSTKSFLNMKSNHWLLELERDLFEIKNF